VAKNRYTADTLIYDILFMTPNCRKANATGVVAYMGYTRNAYKIMDIKPDRRRTAERAGVRGGIVSES
jgi:hypothetical protein